MNADHPWLPEYRSSWLWGALLAAGVAVMVIGLEAGSPALQRVLMGILLAAAGLIFVWCLTMLIDTIRDDY